MTTLKTSGVVESVGGGKPALAGKYLTFSLGRESYGVSVLKVREIIRRSDITSLPQMPDHVLGVVNLRGRIVPVLDLQLKLGRGRTTGGENSCIVVVQVLGKAGRSIQVGLIVTAVEEVAQIAADEIEPVPASGSMSPRDFIVGLAKLKRSVKALLDIDRLLAAAVEPLQTAVTSASAPG